MKIILTCTCREQPFGEHYPLSDAKSDSDRLLHARMIDKEIKKIMSNQKEV